MTNDQHRVLDLHVHKNRRLVFPNIIQRQHKRMQSNNSGVVCTPAAKHPNYEFPRSLTVRNSLLNREEVMVDVVFWAKLSFRSIVYH